MNKESKTISFTSDILKSVSEKNNIPLDIVKFSFDIMLENLESLIKNSSATSIFVPHIGTLYANYHKMVAYKKHAEKKGDNESPYSLKVMNIEKLIEKNKNNRNYNINRHLQKKFLNNRFFSKGLSLQEIEERQNETGK